MDGNRVAMDEREATRLEHGSRVVLARRLAFRYEARQDESLDAFDATDAWHAAIAEVSQKGSGAFADEFRGLSQFDDEEAAPARAASPDPPEYTTARAPDPVPRVVVGGGPSAAAGRAPLTPPRRGSPGTPTWMIWRRRKRSSTRTGGAAGLRGVAAVSLQVLLSSSSAPAAVSASVVAMARVLSICLPDPAASHRAGSSRATRESICYPIGRCFTTAGCIN